MDDLFEAVQELVSESEYCVGVPEDVIYEICDNHVEVHDITSTNPAENHLLGTVSADNDAGCLDYMIKELHRDHPLDGFYVMETAEVHYDQDYWGEWDAELECEAIRPALLSEIPVKLTWRIFWNQLKLAWWDAIGFEI